MRLLVLVPQHQTAIYETYNYKSCGYSSFIRKARDQLSINALYLYILLSAKCAFNGFSCLWCGVVRVVEIVVILLLLLIYFLGIVVF
jgi:hypothetical protein